MCLQILGLRDRRVTAGRWALSGLVSSSTPPWARIGAENLAECEIYYCATRPIGGV